MPPKKRKTDNNKKRGIQSTKGISLIHTRTFSFPSSVCQLLLSGLRKFITYTASYVSKEVLGLCYIELEERENKDGSSTALITIRRRENENERKKMKGKSARSEAIMVVASFFFLVSKKALRDGWMMFETKAIAIRPRVFNNFRTSNSVDRCF